MPTYNNSKSQKRSKSQSKSGGRRKKQTMRKLRRGKKSRKVMRGGGMMWSTFTRINDNYQDNLKYAMNIYFNDFMKNGFKPDTITRNELTTMITKHNDFADPDKRKDMKLKFEQFVDIDWEKGVAILP